MRIAVNDRPTVLMKALRESGVVSDTASISWKSPLGPSFKELRDDAMLQAAGIKSLSRELRDFWPRRGPVWDAIGVSSNDESVLIEAKAHISEVASPATKAASQASRVLIRKSLERARSHYTRGSHCDWSCNFYQYANRLAYQYFLRELSGVPSKLVFLYFLNDPDLGQPAAEAEWRGAIRLIHSVLGLPPSLRSRNVFEAFVDVRTLS